MSRLSSRAETATSVLILHVYAFADATYGTARLVTYVVQRRRARQKLKRAVSLQRPSFNHMHAGTVYV
jgi:hypothetical protein